jgi:hypothetical protein
LAKIVDGAASHPSGKGQQGCTARPQGILEVVSVFGEFPLAKHLSRTAGLMPQSLRNRITREAANGICEDITISSCGAQSSYGGVRINRAIAILEESLHIRSGQRLSKL